MLVARVASGKVGFAEVMAPEVRWRCLIRFEGIRGHRPRCARPPRMPKSADGILERGGFLRNPHSLPTASCAKIFLPPCLSELRHVVLKIFAERGGFEPPKPFWSLHAFQACLFNHSSISPSSECACRIDCRSAALGDRDSSS